MPDHKKGGQKYKPTALKVLQGVPGHRALPLDEPKPELHGGDVPEDLSPQARWMWPKVCAQLKAVGVMTKMDEPALVAYCEQYSIWFDASRKVRRAGGLVTVSSTGYMRPSPYLTIMNTAHDRMLKIWQEFGMTPASRAGVKVSEPPKPKANRFALIKGEA